MPIWEPCGAGVGRAPPGTALAALRIACGDAIDCLPCCDDERMSENDELRAHVLKAFGLKPWDITSAVRPPLRVRLWRKVTFARRRGKVIDWSSYEAAEAEMLARDAEYRAALPGRMAEIADQLSEGLPDGMRFEWGPAGELRHPVRRLPHRRDGYPPFLGVGQPADHRGGGGHVSRRSPDG